MISSIYVLPYKDIDIKKLPQHSPLPVLHSVSVTTVQSFSLNSLHSVSCTNQRWASGHVTRSPPITAHLDHPAHLLLHHAALLPLLDVAHVLAHLTSRHGVIFWNNMFGVNWPRRSGARTLARGSTPRWWGRGSGPACSAAPPPRPPPPRRTTPGQPPGEWRWLHTLNVNSYLIQ